MSSTLRLPTATYARYFVLAALCAGTTIAYIDRGCIGVAEKDIRRELDLSTDQMGYLIGAFFATYALFQIPTGWLGQVWGTRWALPFFGACWSVATGIGAVIDGYPALFLSRLGMGAAEAGIFPCAVGTIALWFPSNRRAWASSILGAFMGIGAVLGAAMTGLLLHRGLSWQMVLAVYALAGLLWSGWFLSWFRNRPEETPAVNEAELALIRGNLPQLLALDNCEDDSPKPLDESIRSAAAAITAAQPSFSDTSPKTAEQPLDPAMVQPPQGIPWYRILTSPAMGWIGAQQFFRAAAFVFYLSWFPTYLKETHGVATLEAGVLTSMPLAAQIFGSPAGGVLSDWVLSATGSRRLGRQVVAASSLGFCSLLIVAAYFVTDPVLAVLVISLGSFCASLAGPSAYAITIDMGGRHVALIFSIMNMAGNLGGVCFPIIVSRMIGETHNWDAVLFLFAGLHLFAGLCWLPFNPDRPIVSDNPLTSQ